MRRRVEATNDFWADLHVALPEGSTPSWSQFAEYDLGVIFLVFADGWDDLMAYGSRGEYRAHIGSGRLGSWHVEARMDTDGVIRLQTIEVEPWPIPSDEPSADS